MKKENKGIEKQGQLLNPIIQAKSQLKKSKE